MTTFHAIEADRALEMLDTTRNGLSEPEVVQRQERFGPNEIPEKRRSRWKAILSQFQDILIYILFGALVLTIVLPLLEDGEFTGEDLIDPLVILGIVVVNAVLGYLQEARAEDAIAALREMSLPETRVRREGRESVVPSRDLVPGDVVVLSAGDRVTADGRLFQTSGLEVDESSLTGESMPQAKSVGSLDDEIGFADRVNMVFSGSFVTAGSANFVVTAIGLETELGRIARMVEEAAIPETPLTRRMKRLSLVLGVIVVVLSAATVGVGIWQGRDLTEIILTGASLAVASVPEGLPAVTTVALALGVGFMAARNVLVRRMESLETLGNVTVICTDKTGTVTENQMEVTDTWTTGDVDEDRLALAAASCNQAELPNLGDPTELGLLRYASERGAERLDIIDIEVPFDSRGKHMRTRHEGLSFLKGAPEVVFDMVESGEAAYEASDRLAKQGLRVLALAEDPGDGLRLLGLIGMQDPPRQGVVEALDQSRTAGIRTVLITGDHAATAAAIAGQVGIEGEVVDGRQLDHWDAGELARRVEEIGVYARVSPEHKLRILEALQSAGHVAAMTGDGVNDAPALQAAHVGIAMGRTGTDIAREASDMVLADDSYASIVAAIKEGRRAYLNIKRVVVYLLQTNLHELLLIGTTLALGLPLPYLPLHLLLVNLMTDSLPAIALATEEAPPDVMEQPPRPTSEGILAGEVGRLVGGAVLAFAAAFALFQGYLEAGASLGVARTVTVAFAVVFELFIAYNLRGTQPVLRLGVFTNRWLNRAVFVPFVLLVALIHTPANTIFRLEPLTIGQWGVVIATAALVFVILETAKVVLARRQSTA